MSICENDACTSGPQNTLYTIATSYSACEDSMRIRSLIAVALLLPAVSEAQLRAPVPGTGRRPGEPVPMGAQPAVVARTLNFTRSRYSVETYPLISRVVAPGFTPGGPSTSST